MRNIYDNSEFFAAYAEMGRSKDGLKAAGEWHQLQPLFPKLQGKKVSRKWEGTLVFCTGNVYTGSIRHRVSTQKEAFCP